MNKNINKNVNIEIIYTLDRKKYNEKTQLTVNVNEQIAQDNLMQTIRVW